MQITNNSKFNEIATIATNVINDEICKGTLHKNIDKLVISGLSSFDRIIGKMINTNCTIEFTITPEYEYDVETDDYIRDDNNEIMIDYYSLNHDNIIFN